ncbi:NAD(P)-dependent oxidoreductase [Jannaschia aquimarina]|uniref:NAD(P)-binding domain-containing protein n=1 Tax=Jannaschia aquimarina TaxID=935700 RepID=A0A0D1D7D0_9RHOB|nr:NAD(P)H-binding protein [Jannaschia aquimarina]KIT15858.1 hypothetical protein jaqu_24380 [Jannaschia aquimarina]SNT10193.1 NAD(P)H-binding [Jannaschia aquimarina]
MHLLIYGADGVTGGRLVGQALARGHKVRASVRSLDGSERGHDQLQWVTSDILAAEQLDRDMEGIDAVLNAVGIDAGPVTAVAPPPLHSQGTRNILSAMRATGVDRLITISATFVETLERGPIAFRAAASVGLRAIFDDMALMEKILAQQSDLRWTAIRPGWLLDEDPTEDYGVFADVIPQDLIRTRTGDLAHFMLRCAEEDLHIRETPAIARAEPEEKSDMQAVLKEMAG